MLFRDAPIRRRLMTIILLTCGAVLLLTCVSFFAYEFYSFRQSTITNVSTIGSILASNSTAALTFADSDDAAEVLAALQAEPHVQAASLYDENGKLFAPKWVFRATGDFWFIGGHRRGLLPTCIRLRRGRFPCDRREPSGTLS